MSDKSNQQISNLMDGELEVNASQFLLKRMAADVSLSKTWKNYHLIKSCLQKEPKEPLLIDIAARVSEQLNHESRYVETPQNDKTQVSSLNRWIKPIMGLGIAASVAFMSVIMLQNQKIDAIDGTTTAITIAKQSLIQPLETGISAKMVSSGQTIVPPPPMLSRFPSVSAKNNFASHYNQGFTQNYNAPYIIILNKNKINNVKQLSPMRIKDVTD